MLIVFIILMKVFVRMVMPHIYIYESSYMYTKTVLTPTLVSVSYESTWDPQTCTLLSGNFTI